MAVKYGHFNEALKHIVEQCNFMLDTRPEGSRPSESIYLSPTKAAKPLTKNDFAVASPTALRADVPNAFPDLTKASSLDMSALSVVHPHIKPRCKRE